MNIPRMKRGFFQDSTNLLLLAIILVIAVLLSGIVFLIFRANKNTSPSTQKNANTPSPVISLSPTLKQFKGTGYTLEYPDNLIVMVDTTKQMVTFSSGVGKTLVPVFTVQIVTSPFKNSPKANQTIEGIKYVSEWKEITVDGQKAHHYVKNPCEKTCRILAVDLPYKNGTEIISINYLSDDEAIFSTILSNFKYTK